MNDSVDGYIQQALKNWAVEQKPPFNGRARLLLLAASQSSQRASCVEKHIPSVDITKIEYRPINLASNLSDLPYLLSVQLTYTTLRRVT